MTSILIHSSYTPLTTMPYVSLFRKSIEYVMYMRLVLRSVAMRRLESGEGSARPAEIDVSY